MLGWGEEINFAIYWLDLVTNRTIRLRWKFKLRIMEPVFDLKLFSYGFGSFISVFKFLFQLFSIR